jgi:site-specific DNA recombinase
LRELRGIHYARVSDTSQVSGASLDQQTAHGIEWFARKGAELVRYFREEGESGRSAKRSTLTQALEFIRAERRAGRAIDLFVIHDLSRFFRNLEEQWAVKKTLADLGTRLDSVMFPITEDAHGRAMQNFLGTSNQFLVELNAEKIRDCMLARKRQGRWPHPAPVGYRNRKNEDGSKKWIEPDVDKAPLIRAAFEAVSRGEGIAATLDAVTTRGLRSKNGLPLRPQEFRDVLQNPIYAGRIRSIKYGFEVDGEHEAIVDADTFARVGDLLAGRGAHASHSHLHEDFPLRGFVRCEDCGRPLTSEWSRGKSGRRYAYYRCWLPSCRAVKIPAAKLEQAVADDLGRRGLSGPDLLLFQGILRAVLAEESKGAETARARLNQRVLDLKRRQNRIIDAFLHDGAIDRATYDEQMHRVQGEIAAANFELSQARPADDLFEEVFRSAEPILTRPAELWLSGSAAERRAFQTLVYPAGLVLGRDSLRTPEVAFVYSALEQFGAQEKDMVQPEGFEPPTLRFEV